MANGAKNVVAPETNFTADVDAILKLVSPRTKLVWLANPNNPTGTYLPFDEVKRLRAGLPAHVLLVLDAAYSDYVSRNDYELGLELVATTENTVMTHTFSKIHGLAALADRLDVRPRPHRRRRQPHPRPLQRLDAGDAGGGGGDRGHRACPDVEGAHREMAQLADGGDHQARPEGDAERGEFRPDPFPDEKGKTAAEADAFLTKRGLVLRALNNYGLPHALRMTIGTEEANRLVVEGLRDFMARK